MKISEETIALLEKHAGTSEPCRLIKLAINNGFSINQIAELADVSRATISNWIQGYAAQAMSVSLLKKRLREKGFLKDNETRSRFLIPEIRSAIVLQKSIERSERLKLEQKAAEEKRLSVELNHAEERKRIIFIEEYGRKMLETAINGKTSLLVFNHTQNQFDLCEEVSKRGFGIIEYGEYDIKDLQIKDQKKYEKYFKATVQKLSELDQDIASNLKNKIISALLEIKSKLKSLNDFRINFDYFKSLDHLIPGAKADLKNDNLLSLVELGITVLDLPRLKMDAGENPLLEEIMFLNGIVSPYRDDDGYILEQSISWNYPDYHDKCIKDCIHAKFLDWVSDIYGRELISKIFPLIESCDLDNKKEVNIVIERHKTWNEYTNNEIKDLIQIFNIDIPFSLRTVRSMFNILNYDTEFIKTSEGDKKMIGNLILRWS